MASGRTLTDLGEVVHRERREQPRATRESTEIGRSLQKSSRALGDRRRVATIECRENTSAEESRAIAAPREGNANSWETRGIDRVERSAVHLGGEVALREPFTKSGVGERPTRGGIFGFRGVERLVAYRIG